MKKKIAGIFMVLSFILLARFIGGLNRDTLTAGQAATGGIIILAVFFITGGIGGVIK